MWLLAYQVGSFFAIRIAVVMSLLAADLTVYSENATPILALKQIYHETGVPSEIRIKLWYSVDRRLRKFGRVQCRAPRWNRQHPGRS